MHPALRKGPLFLQKNAPHFPLFFYKKTPPISFPAYGPAYNGPLSGTTQVSRYQKGKNNLDFTEAGDSEWQWHQQGHMQVCILLQIDNHVKQFFTGRMPFLPPNQQRQSTEGKFPML